MALALGLGAVPGIGGAQSNPVISHTNGRLSVRVREMPLGQVLEHIVARSGISIAAAGNLDAPVSAYFEGVEADEAIRRLAGPHATVWVTVPLQPALRPPGNVLGVPPRSMPPSRPSADAEGFEAASRALRDADPRVRVRGVLALGRMQAPQAVGALRAAAFDPVASVRLQVVYALRRIEADEAIPALAELAGGDPDVNVRRSAVRVLAALRGPDVVPALQWASRDPDAGIRREAERALARIGSRP